MYRDSAPVYEMLYAAAGKDYAAEARELHELIQARRPGAASLLDVACGTGAHLARFRRWYDVTGIDVEPQMIDEARRRLPGIPLHVADMRTFDLACTFDAVVCLFTSIAFLPSAEDMTRAVGRMAAHLAPGGVLVIDGWVRPDAWQDDPGFRAVAANAPSVAAARVGRSRRDGNRTFIESHHLIGTDEGVQYVVEEHQLMLFTEEEYLGALGAAGLTGEILPGPHQGGDRYLARGPY